MIKAILGWLGLLTAVIAGLAAAGAAMWLLAPKSGSLALLAAAALAIGFGVSALVGRLAGGWTGLRPAATALAPALVAALLLGGGASWLATMPLAARPLPAVDRRGPHESWSLATGSRIAAWVKPADSAARHRATPVIFLHGGAGGQIRPRDFAMGAPFRAAGFDTVYFDQAGSGRSADIPAGDYSVARSVADLEALRARLGAEKLVLWGESWGATLAAAYGLAKPQRLAAIIVSSPGEYPGQVLPEDYSRTDQDDSFSPPPRLAALYLLLGRNPALAEQWLPQSIHHSHVDALSNVAAPGLRCKGAPHPPLDRIGGGSLYALRRIRMDVEALPDPGKDVRPLPALIVRGGCDFIPAAAAKRFATAYAPARQVAIPGAGHMLLEHEGAFERAAAAFAATDLAAVK